MATICRMSEEIRRVPEYESGDGVHEQWHRFTNDPDIKSISATWFTHEDWSGWQVTVAVAEFLRDDPLGRELRERMTSALSGIDGAEDAFQDDTEAWLVTGSPSGEGLVRAAAQVVDDLGDRAREYIDSLAGEDDA
jgi:hypothetical protein